MANEVYVEQYKVCLRDGAGAVVPVEGALLDGGSDVLVATSGDTVTILSDTKFIYVRPTADCYGGFTSTPANLEDGGSLDADRYDLAADTPRWITVKDNITSFSVILKADA